MRITLVTEIPAPFRIPLWNALAAELDVELTVVLLAEHDPRRTYEVDRGEWHFDARVLPGRGLVRGGRWLVLSRRVAATLGELRPDVLLVGGWNQPAFLRAVAWARRRRIPLVLWVESTARDERSGRADRLKRRIVRAATAVVVPGRAAADYVRSLGAERIVVAPNAFDSATFADAVTGARGHREELRRELGLERPCFLTVSRLSREKGVDVAVCAVAGVEADLVVAGDGPQRDELERIAPANVRLLGHVRRDDLPPLYAAADAFVLSSRSETWGMALSEAAAAGLPLVATDAVGAAWDLVEPGVNGFRVPTADEGRLREALAAVAADAAFRERAGARSRELAAAATSEAWASAVAGLARTLA